MSAGPAGVWSVRHGEDGYPPAFEDLANRAPATVYGCGDRGTLRHWDAEAAVTIVGARRASPYGLAVAEELGRLLASAGLTVVSGMARGIDAAAHRGALAADATTIAVLGGGADVIYPSGERRLYERILERGVAISERPPGTRPEAWCFPARNRLMAALSAFTVVVEAAERSGSLVTAREALTLGRSLGAVPGPVTSWLSAGSNHLLADGAVVVRDAQDVLDAMLGIGVRSVRDTGPELEPELGEVLGLVEVGHASCDAVASALGSAPQRAAVALARLELLGYLRADATGRYGRTALLPPDRGSPAS